MGPPVRQRGALAPDPSARPRPCRSRPASLPRLRRLLRLARPRAPPAPLAPCPPWRPPPCPPRCPPRPGRATKRERPVETPPGALPSGGPREPPPLHRVHRGWPQKALSQGSARRLQCGVDLPESTPPLNTFAVLDSYASAFVLPMGENPYFGPGGPSGGRSLPARPCGRWRGKRSRVGQPREAPPWAPGSDAGRGSEAGACPHEKAPGHGPGGF